MRVSNQETFIEVGTAGAVERIGSGDQMRTLSVFVDQIGIRQ
jgi:hypothetical protein